MVNLPFIFISFIAAVIKGANTGQKVLKNLTAKPSITRAEIGFMSLNSDSSSPFKVKGPSSSCLSSSDTCLHRNSS